MIFFTTLSLFLFVRLGNLKPDENPSTDWRDRLPKSSIAFLAIYSAMALAVLAKGPVGVLLPSVVIGFFLYAFAVNHRPPLEENAHQTSRWSRWGNALKCWFQPAEFFRIAWAMRPYWIVICVAVIALPWYVAVGIKTNGAWLEGFLGQHNVSRFLKPMEGHHGPVLYYPIAMLIGFFPWSVFCLPVIRGVLKRLKCEASEYSGAVVRRVLVSGVSGVLHLCPHQVAQLRPALLPGDRAFDRVVVRAGGRRRRVPKRSSRFHLGCMDFDGRRTRDGCWLGRGIIVVIAR